MATRILAVHYTPPGVVGGVEHILHQHLQLLAARGFRVQVMAGRPGVTDIRTHVVPEIEAATAESQRVEDELAAGVVSPEFHRRRRVILDRLESLAADADFVIVHNAFTFHFGLPLTAALWVLAGKRRSGSVIAWSHDVSWVNPLYISSMHPGYPWDLTRTPAPNVTYVTVSEERKYELHGVWGHAQAPVRVIPNGIDAASVLRLSPAMREIVARYKLFARDIVLVLPVRITRRKNIELAVRVVASLKARGLDLRFLISSPIAPHHPGRSHDYLDRLKELRKQLGVEDEVVFLADDLGANLDDQTVAELYAVGDALLFPSASEGFGLPILEAGLEHLPVIASDIPIFHEVGKDDIWRFDLNEDPDHIATIVLEALQTRQSRLYRRVLRDFRWEVIVERDLLPLLGQEPDAGDGQ